MWTFSAENGNVWLMICHVGNLVIINMHAIPFYVSFMSYKLYLYMTGDDIMKERCNCEDRFWMHGCPRDTKQVISCQPKKPEKDTICCAQSKQKNKKKHSQAHKSQIPKSLKPKPKNVPVIKKGSILRLLRVFDR